MLNICPECKKPAVPLIKKALSSSYGVFTCQNCGSRLKLPAWNIIFGVILLAVVSFANFGILINYTGLGLINFAIYIFSYMVLYIVFLTIVPFKRPKREKATKNS